MDFAIETNGPFSPTWTSIAANVPGNGTPAWLRQAKFGIWFHYGPQANLQSGDWSAQHMYQQGAGAYSFHTNYFGHPTTNGYKDVIRAWAPTNYSPAGLAQLFYNAGARFVLVQGVHHDNFDNWNSRYNPWNIVNFGALCGFLLLHVSVLVKFGIKGRSSQWFVHWAVPILGIVVVLAVLQGMSTLARNVGLLWLIAGLLFGFALYLMRRDELHTGL